MAGSSFGTLFRVTTFGESHCKGVGAIVDGVPPSLALTEADIQPQLTRRRPGQSRLTTPRDETDLVTILSGTELGRTLGTPVALFVPNQNVRPGDYAEIHAIPRPGHADYTYGAKYGVQASSGGGRASARETIGRVAAGAIAEKWLRETFGTEIVTFVSSIGTVDLPPEHLAAPGGVPWTRAQVDQQGTLTLLRDAARTGWRCLRAEREAAEAAPADAEAAAAGLGGFSLPAAAPATEKAAQAALDATDEAAFVAAYRLGEAASAGDGAAAPYTRGRACYEGAHGDLYDMWGAPVPAPAAGTAPEWVRTDEVVVLRCPHAATAARMASLIRLVKAEQDSTGGVLTTVATGVPVGLGEPSFDKAEALLAHAMLSLPATKGFEIGSGFAGSRLRGSTHNDPFVGVVAAASTTTAAAAAASGAAPASCTCACACSSCSAKGCGPAAAVPAEPAPALLRPATNNAGGTLGGITSGAPLHFRVPIKPVSTIGQAQATADYSGAPAVLEAKGRHDPCVLPRAPPLIEAMTALVLADLALIQRSRGAPVRVLPPL